MRSGKEADFAHSLTDLMSGVAVTFLVIAAIFMVQASQAKQRAMMDQQRAEELARNSEDNAEKYRELDERDRRGILEIQQLREQLDAFSSITLLYDPNKDPWLLTIVFDPESLRFASGACEVEDALVESLHATLRDIFPPICSSVGSGLHKSITLEGHTDNQPPLGVSCKAVGVARSCSRRGDPQRCLDEGLESNVQLSAARAQYVFFQARRALAQDRAVAGCLDRDFLVAGRGPMEPLDASSWNAPRSVSEQERQRRVVIKVRVTAERRGP